MSGGIQPNSFAVEGAKAKTSWVATRELCVFPRIRRLTRFLNSTSPDEAGEKHGREKGRTPLMHLDGSPPAVL
jgi:hypothetical protein